MEIGSTTGFTKLKIALVDIVMYNTVPSYNWNGYYDTGKVRCMIATHVTTFGSYVNYIPSNLRFYSYFFV